jgi:purine-nucleoside phosphorylase
LSLPRSSSAGPPAAGASPEADATAAARPADTLDDQLLYDQIGAAAAAIRGRWTSVPRVGLILGTGLGRFASLIETDARIPYADIPHFAASTVASHTGQLVCGRLGGVPLVALEGRVHFYEGYTMRQVTFPVRVIKALGAETLIATNAAGAMNLDYELADVVIVDDHINLMPDNPLRGINDDRLGPRFPDMSGPYDRELTNVARQAATELGVPTRTGVFVAVPGPNLETRAEYRMLRNLGADIVGMSTVPEVIVAAHAGLRTLVLSIVTDLCDPDSLEPATLEKMLAVAERGAGHLERLIPRIVAHLGP